MNYCSKLQYKSYLMQMINENNCRIMVSTKLKYYHEGLQPIFYAVSRQIFAFKFYISCFIKFEILVCNTLNNIGRALLIAACNSTILLQSCTNGYVKCRPDLNWLQIGTGNKLNPLLFTLHFSFPFCNQFNNSKL